MQYARQPVLDAADDNQAMKTVDQIAAELQGYDPAALPADKVNEFLALLVAPVQQAETVPLQAALGRVLAHDVVSPISVPPHDNSAMDGFAFAGADLKTESVSRFQVVGTALAGKAWQGSVGPGECIKIMTGAIMPDGLDTVVPQELCTLVTHDSVAAQNTTATSAYPTSANPPPNPLIDIPPGLLQPGDNRRLLGEDLLQGAPALSAGDVLSPAALGLLASLNIGQVSVWRKLKVAYFSTGDEVLSLGDAPREGAIYDSNRYTVHGMLTRLGVDVIDMGVVGDDPALLEAAFRSAAAQADAIITSGGVSVGEADHTKAMMRKLGSEGDDNRSGENQGGGVAFWRIAMRPGRPMAVGRIAAARGLPAQGVPDGVQNPKTSTSTPRNNNEIAVSGRIICSSSYEINSSILFGLPGNPVAVMVTMLAFVRPALLRMMGANPAKYCAAPLYLPAHSSEALRKKPGRTEYQRGCVTRAANGQLQVKTTGNQGSGVLSSMVQANGLIVLHHSQGNVAVGDVVDVLMFDWE
jgi:molybdopterin molybdotransferase